MRFPRLLLLLVTVTVLNVHRGTADPDPNDEEEFDMEGLLEALIKTRGRSSASPPLASAHPSYSALEALISESDLFQREASTKLRGAAPQESLSTGTAGQARGNTARYRKDSVDADSMRTREKYQRNQADRLRKAYKEGKQQIRLVGASSIPETNEGRWEVPCALEFYEDAYGVVPGCTPSVARNGACSRVVLDDFATVKEATEAAMVNLFHQGGTTSLAPASSLDRLGPRGANLFQYFLSKAKLRLMDDFGLDVIYDSGALLTRLEGDPRHDEWDVEPGHVYWNPHVDKANIPTYDYSALLYLNTHGTDFEGGEFAFLDDDADRVVSPRAGRLLYFTSGPENLHQVREVTHGTRYVLAMWFTCSKADRYSEDGDTN